jgi:hypothetical protein
MPRSAKRSLWLAYHTQEEIADTHDGTVYDAVSREMRVTVPDGSVIDWDRNVLCWRGEKGPVQSTVDEVYELVQAHASGFGTAS